SLNNPREMWKTVTEFSERGSGGSRNDIDKITVHGREMVDGEEIANEFNEFFTNIRKKLTEKIKQPLGENVRPPDRVVDSFVLKPTTPKELMKTIKSRKSKKSFGIDSITTEVSLNKNRRFPTDQLYEEEKVLDISQIYLNLAIDVIRWGLEELKKIDYNYQTRKNCSFLIPRTLPSKGLKSKSYMVARVFNSMTGDIKKIVDPTRMKKRLKGRMISILEVYMESDIHIPHDSWTERLG
ncbi:hypothetical protein HHI36_014450, partial [Cryptolaemus montrouzieri]